MEEGIEGVAAGEGVADPIAGATKAADDLYAFRDTYFPSDPAEKISALHQQADIAPRILDDAFPLGQTKERSQRASFEFLRGKILDVYPDYRKEAEDHLSKAVKLNPSLLDAWLCLGNCMWKKGDLSSARNCFSLALQKGPDKKILSQLSMLERRLAQGAENHSEMVDESIRHAKEAVMLDVKDGYSWCKIKEGDRLTLINPFNRVVDFTWKAKAYYFKSLRVDFLEQIHINGMLADQRYAIRNSIHAHHVP